MNHIEINQEPDEPYKILKFKSIVSSDDEALTWLVKVERWIPTMNGCA
jgi:hypothetical protein